MPIYLAASTPSGAVSHPLFKQRKLDTFTQCSLSALFHQGYPYVPEIAYSGYKDNIDMFLAATSNGRKMNTTYSDGSLRTDRPTPLLTAPLVGFIPRVKLNSEQEGAMMVKLKEYQPSTRKQGKTTIILLNKIIPSFLPKLKQICVENMNASTDFFTPQMYAAYHKAHIILSEFLATNTYPAYPQDSWESGKEDFFELLIPYANNTPATKRTVRDGKDITRAGVESVPKDDQGGSDEDVEMEEQTPAKIYSVLGPVVLQTAVLVAKPSPLPASASIGGIADVPYMPGLVFPYFDRMNMPDQSTIRSIAGKYFIRCFGSDREEQNENFKSWGKSIGDISRFKEGGILAHMFVGMDLALETQTRLFIVRDKTEYIGFVLLGGKFHVNIASRVYHAVSPELLRKDLAHMSAHSVCLDAILSGIEKLRISAKDGSEDPREIDRDSVTNAQDLWDEIAKREFKTDEHKAILEQNVGGLSFARSYKPVDVDSLLDCFRRIAGIADKALDRDVPVYLPSNPSLYGSPVARQLAVFGPLPPSFINTKGSSYTIQSDPNTDPNEKEDASKVKGLPHILVALKPIALAVADMNKFIKDKALMMDLKERAGKNRNIVFTGAQRDKLYGGLREVLYKEGTKLSTKRKRGDDEDGPESKVFKGADDFLDFL